MGFICEVFNCCCKNKPIRPPGDTDLPEADDFKSALDEYIKNGDADVDSLRKDALSLRSENFNEYAEIIYKSIPRVVHENANISSVSIALIMRDYAQLLYSIDGREGDADIIMLALLI